MERCRLTTMESVREYALAGNATMTLVSAKTQTRFTFRVRRPKPDKPWFVSLLRGPNNEDDYTFLGTVFPPVGIQSYLYRASRKSRVSEGAPSQRVVTWFVKLLSKQELPPSLEVWHEGRCGRCGRKLTVPESLARGIGPECAGALRQKDMFKEGL